MSISSSDPCRKCRKEGLGEALVHILFFRSILAITRLRYLEVLQFKSLKGASELQIKEILSFVKDFDVHSDDYFRSQYNGLPSDTTNDQRVYVLHNRCPV